MNTSIERLEDSAVTLTVTVSAEDVDAAIESAYQSAGADRTFPGFRKGKAPRSVLDASIGREAILSEASSTLSKNACARAIVAEELLVIGEPAIMLSAPVKQGEEYTFTAKLELRPELTLSGYDALVVKVPPVTVTDDEIDDAMEQFRQSLGTFEVAPEQAVGPADMIVASITSEIEGIEESRNTTSAQPYELGRGSMPPGFDEGLLGHVAGDTVHVEVAVPGSAPSPEEEDRKAIFDVTIHEVRTKNAPELSDATAEMFGFGDLTAMREEFTQRLQADRDRLYERVRVMGARRVLADRLEGEVPASMINARVSEALRVLSHDLEQRQIPFEQYCQSHGVSPQEFFTNARMASEHELQETLALEALYRALGLEFTDEDVESMLAEISSATGTTIEEQRKEWNGPMRPRMRLGLQARMAMNWLLEHIELETVEPGVTPSGEETAVGQEDAVVSEQIDAVATEDE